MSISDPGPSQFVHESHAVHVGEFSAPDTADELGKEQIKGVSCTLPDAHDTSHDPPTGSVLNDAHAPVV